MIDKNRKINPVHPETILIQEAARLIKKGGVVVFPTTSLYGIGVDAFDKAAIDRIFIIKQRPEYKPLLILINHKDELDRLVQKIPPYAVSIMESFWPGGVTIIFEAKPSLPPNLTAGSGKIGIRVPRHQVALALVEELGSPITGTSANISGNAECSSILDLDLSVVSNVDLILDAGQLKGSPGSTVIDITVDPPKILREGRITGQEIFSALGVDLKKMD